MSCPRLYPRKTVCYDGSRYRSGFSTGDLAILDIDFPDLAGDEVFTLARKVRPDLKAIVCGGYAIDGPAQEILNAGPHGFIQKPFAFQTLSAELKEVLNSS